MNNRITAKTVQVINFDGQNMGAMPINQALQIASDAGLDLVEMNANAPVPIVKVMDYGKFKYEQKKRASEAKKNQKTTELKEVWIKPFIEENDLNIKMKNGRFTVGSIQRATMTRKSRNYYKKGKANSCKI